MKINRISPDEHDFFKRCDCIAKKPKSLYFIGQLPAQATPTVAIIGTRRPTPYGKEVTRRIGEQLARAGVVIISGLALGIDAVAHEAALSVGGSTVAILPGGVDTPYPRSHHDLAMRIIAHHGALVSEYAPGVQPLLYHFPERNRIVSGLADALIITEATTKSGTLGTVAHALEQGKPVFAVPGNITSPQSAGCNHLIAQGATPLIAVENILEELGLTSSPRQSTLFGDTDAETALLKLLYKGIRDGDTLLMQSRLSTSEFNQAMTMLEINGRITPLGANQFGLK